jgi:DNA-binding phage protein
MPTISYNDSLKGMIGQKPELGAELLEDAVNSLLAGDLDEGRLLLRQFVNATIGFKELAARTGKIDKNLMRTLSISGNPTAANLFEIVRACVEAQGLTIDAHVRKAPDAALEKL